MPHCKYCGQQIRGQYVSALGASWHPEHFLCAGCGQPLGTGQFQIVQNQPYHSACYLLYQAPRCGYCQKPIERVYVEYEGKRYHPECHREHILPRCVYCQKPLAGRYFFDAWGNKFCMEHEREYPHCSFCSRLRSLVTQSQKVNCSVPITSFSLRDWHSPERYILLEDKKQA